MRYWSPVLHFYQPPTQDTAITKQILDSCYLPILRILTKKSGFGLTINLSGTLILQLREFESTEFFDLIRQLLADGKIELLNSAVYHPIIPLTPPDVVTRQISRNQLQLKNFFGLQSSPGFFPPELAIDTTSLDLIDSQYVVIDQTSLDTYSPLHKFGQKHLLVNNRPVSDLLRAYPKELKIQTLTNLIVKNCADGGLLVTANDAELFGHHYAERIQLLPDLLDLKDIKLITASQALSQFGSQASEISAIKASTWQECQHFSLWDKNGLQKSYLKLLTTAYDLTHDSQEYKVDDYLDKAFSSCYLYWLSNWPWWHPEMVETGAIALITAVRIAKTDPSKKSQMEVIYHDFLSKMWQYQWSGEVELNYQKYNLSSDKFLRI